MLNPWKTLAMKIVKDLVEIRDRCVDEDYDTLSYWIEEANELASDEDHDPLAEAGIKVCGWCGKVYTSGVEVEHIVKGTRLVSPGCSKPCAQQISFLRLDDFIRKDFNEREAQ